MRDEPGLKWVRLPFVLRFRLMVSAFDIYFFPFVGGRKRQRGHTFLARLVERYPPRGQFHRNPCLAILDTFVVPYDKLNEGRSYTERRKAANPTKFDLVVNLKTAKAARPHDPRDHTCARRRGGRIGGCLLQRICPLWSKADIEVLPLNVCFTPESGHRNSVMECPLCAKSRHSALRHLIAIY